MSKIIKFRAWDAEKKKMYSGDEIEGREDLDAWLSYGELSIYRITDGDYHQLKVMQFTGLYDKNGVEIYEGDICSVYEVMEYRGNLEERSYITDIKWDEGAFVVKSKSDNDYDTFLSGWFPGGGIRYPQIEFEVIGDIYEHPHLLESNKK